ncbi:MAG: TonB-dependent receptor [Dysgonamonadaceae bacterium]|jgi:TonB-linked SusC/RagA family outer membrane protein|nr:TonB-dependent receptor [Dysgonamonadaceae bacterium]
MRKKLFVLFLSLISYCSISAQSVVVNGVVTDEKNESIPGASVTVKGSTRGVTTDLDGSYSISVKPEDVLEFSFLGYEKKTVTVGTQTSISVQLKPTANELDEVTVVAFGKQKKESVVSSIQTVNTKDLKIPSSNLTTAFAGKIPGIISYQTTGEPGADNAQFFVRGVTTFGYKADPLILIDGFESTSNDLARLQPDDIEAFSVLKDASATAMYGPRGANGIILVTTKTGKEGPVKMNIRIDTRVATPTKMNEFIDGVSYMRMYNEALLTRTANEKAYYSEQKIQATEKGVNPMVYPNVQWLDELFKSSTSNTKANINVSGGGNVAKYYVSAGYDHETGLLNVDNRSNFNNNIGIDRFNIRSNVVFKLTSTTTLDTRIQGRFERYNGPYHATTDIYNMIMASNPVDFPAVYEPDKANLFTKHTLFGNAFISGGMMQNPYAEMVMGYQNRDDNTITAMATFSQDLDFILKNLKFQAKASANTWSSYTAKRRYSPYYYMVDGYNIISDEYVLFCMNSTSGQAYLGNVEPYRDATNHYYFEGRLNWEGKYNKHNVGLMTVFTSEQSLLTGGNSSNIFETLPERNLGNSGRLTYDYDTRYFFEFVYGYNGSEKFTGKHKFGFFPSAGLGWLVSNEAFWAPVKKYVGNAKLKFTYGRTGNDAIAGRAGRFWFLSDIEIGSGGQYTWGKLFQTSYGGYNIKRIANLDMTWEVSDKMNLGLELGFLKNDALKINVDFFKDRRSSIYGIRSNIPSTAGWTTSPSGNTGEVKSKGIDGSIDFQHSFNRDFWLTGRVNLTYSTNKYAQLDELNYPYDYLQHKGKPVYQLYGLVAERLFVDQAEIDHSPKQEFGLYMAGDIKYKDVNNDGVVNSYDAVPMGYPSIPEIQYGFGLSSGYKKVDFSFFFQGTGRVSFFIDESAITPFVNRRNALAFIADSYWSESNPDVHALFPRLSTAVIANNSQPSSWWLRDGSFLRLKTIEAGYTIGGFKSLANSRIYISAENLFVISAFKLWDPEVGSNGLNYPLNRTFNLGLQLNF